MSADGRTFPRPWIRDGKNPSIGCEAVSDLRILRAPPIRSPKAPRTPAGKGSEDEQSGRRLPAPLILGRECVWREKGWLGSGKQVITQQRRRTRLCNAVGPSDCCASCASGTSCAGGCPACTEGSITKWWSTLPMAETHHWMRTFVDT